MNTAVIYEEKIFLKGQTLLLALISSVFISILIYQAVIGPVWFLLALFLLFLILTVSFSNLTIRITSQGVSLEYGILKLNIPWENIEDCYLDNAPIFRYGGWGVRVSRVGGKWRLVFNPVFGSPRVVLLLKEGKFKEIVFSTRNPEEVIKTVKQNIAGDESDV